jgi:hypothetical protein
MRPRLARGIGRRVGQAQQLADLLHREAELPGVADEAQPVEVGTGIDAVATLGAAWGSSSPSAS